MVTSFNLISPDTKKSSKVVCLIYVFDSDSEKCKENNEVSDELECVEHLPKLLKECFDDILRHIYFDIINTSLLGDICQERFQYILLLTYIVYLCINLVVIPSCDMNLHTMVRRYFYLGSRWKRPINRNARINYSLEPTVFLFSM